jgi:hypothetical protein
VELSTGESSREVAARLYDEAAAELELAAEHCRVAAGDFRTGNIDHGAARALAAYGHLLAAQERLHAQARQHAGRVSADAGLPVPPAPES